jgi:hypothetical protein
MGNHGKAVGFTTAKGGSAATRVVYARHLGVGWSQ